MNFNVLQLNVSTTENYQEDFTKINLWTPENFSSLQTTDDNQCRSPPPIIGEDSHTVVNFEICECPPVQPRKEENVFLTNVVVNRGMLYVSRHCYKFILKYICILIYKLPYVFQNYININKLNIIPLIRNIYYRYLIIYYIKIIIFI